MEIRVPVVAVIDVEPIRRGWEDHVADCAERDETPEPYDDWEREWVDGIIGDFVGFSRGVYIERQDEDD